MLRIVTAGALVLAFASGAPTSSAAQDAAAPSPAAATKATDTKATDTKAAKPASKAKAAAPQALSGPQVVVLETSQGTIVIKLSDADAPKTPRTSEARAREVLRRDVRSIA